MTDLSPGDGGQNGVQLKQLRDALERAIISSLQLLDQLESELCCVQSQEEIGQRKSRAAALIDVKKILEPLPLPQKPDVPLDPTIADPKVANFKRNIQAVILECQLKLRGMRHFLPKLIDVAKGTSLARILSLLQKRLQGEKIDQILASGSGSSIAADASAAPPSPIPSPTPSPSPLSSSSTSAANSPPAIGSLSQPADVHDTLLVLPAVRKDSSAGRLSTPILQGGSQIGRPPRAISLESERESASRLVQLGAMEAAAVQNPDPHKAIPKNHPLETTPAESVRANPQAPSSGPGMTPTPQNPPPVAPTPKSMLSLSLSNLGKVTESPPNSPDPPKASAPKLLRPDSKDSIVVSSPRAPADFRGKPLPQTPQTPRSAAPSAGPGGAPSAGPGTSSPAQLSPRGNDVMRASDPNPGLGSEMRGRALSRSESGLQRPNFTSTNATDSPKEPSSRPESVEGAPPKLSRSGTRQALVLRKDTQEMPPTPRSRGKVGLQDDVKIWDEGPDTATNFVTEKQGDMAIVVNASFNKLVEKLTSPSIETQDPLFSKIFYYTFQAWATPKALLLKLMERFAIPTVVAADEGLAIQKKTCQVLKRWIELLQQDFGNEEMQVLAAGFTEDMKRAKLAVEAEEIVSLLAEKTIRLTRKDSSILNWDAIVRSSTQAPPPPKCVMSTKIYPDNILGFLNIDEEELARQLCLMDFGNFSTIRPRELLGQAWARPEATTFAPNVLGHINHFNVVSLVCVYMIVHPENAKDRARVVTKWIGIMKHLRAFNNFSSLMAIVAGLNNSAVLRLKRTLAEVPPESLKLYSEYESLMKSEASYRTYRETLRSATLPSIPYLGVHVQDLTFMDENPDQTNGMINFHKNRLLYTAISELMRCQSVNYNFTPLIQLQNSLRALASMDLNKLYQVSLVREPRDANKGSEDGTPKKVGTKTFGLAMSKITKQVINELERNDPH